MLATSELEEGVAAELLDVYRRLSRSEPTLADLRAAIDGARKLLEAGLSAEKLHAFWSVRLTDFYPAVIPDVAFLVQPAALAEAPHWSTTAAAPTPAATLDPRLIAVLREHGGQEPWTMGAALLLQRTVEASTAGCEPYISPQLAALVGQARAARRKQAPVLR